MINYETEARSRWGNTDAYREHEQKTKNYTKEKWAEANDGMMAIFAEFAACKGRGASAHSAEAQALVAKLQAHITANYYTCTDEILAGLGKMYVADERFKKNIDKCGEGTAYFVADAILKYCYVKKGVSVCDECGSEYLASKSNMICLCPECSHILYGYDNCNHVFKDGRCSSCLWEVSRSDYIKELLND